MPIGGVENSHKEMIIEKRFNAEGAENAEENKLSTLPFLLRQFIIGHFLDGSTDELNEHECIGAVDGRTALTHG